MYQALQEGLKQKAAAPRALELRLMLNALQGARKGNKNGKITIPKGRHTHLRKDKRRAKVFPSGGIS